MGAKRLYGDTRDDIERWGSGVIWAEHYTGIGRWDARDDADDRWHPLIGIPWTIEGNRCDGLPASLSVIGTA